MFIRIRKCRWRWPLALGIMIEPNKTLTKPIKTNIIFLRILIPYRDIIITILKRKNQGVKP